MFLGSQLVHNFYKPMHDLREYIEEELKELPEEERRRVRELL
jgi:hypothetical protein